jgi:hypothetical protein
MQQGTQPASASGVPSTEAKIGRILVLIGAIVASFSALLMIGMAVSYSLLFRRIPTEAAPMFFSFGILVFFGGLSLIGSVVGFIAWAKAARDPRKAGFLGIIAAVLPPTNVFALAGGILLLISPEGKAQDQAVRSGQDMVAPRH